MFRLSYRLKLIPLLFSCLSGQKSFSLFFLQRFPKGLFAPCENFLRGCGAQRLLHHFYRGRRYHCRQTQYQTSKITLGLIAFDMFKLDLKR